MNECIHLMSVLLMVVDDESSQRSTTVKICTVIGFPLGATGARSKEVRRYILHQFIISMAHPPLMMMMMMIIEIIYY